MAAKESKPKWEGKATVELPGTTAEAAWAVVSDFCNLHKWIPIDTCYQVDQDQPGLFRYCTSIIKTDGSAVMDEKARTTKIKWAKEKLLVNDPVQHCLSYAVIDSNIGFTNYVATMSVVPIAMAAEAGCKMEWGFVCDPVEGRTCEDLRSYIESYLRFMANKIELAGKKEFGI
ncbi:lachrymatory-factor synthase-like [Lotus japonicus]|uniref:lachrymatory-factor synthase-like n=1 Tax=Lotus japonicus TaxID=34305 RepID=UPI002583B076|nr:lachrymatory-factor synthase-like [Lotus japonicus]